jgi:hypothetical protein
MESKVFVKSLGLYLLSLINIDDLPSLVDLSVSLVQDNILVFSVLSSFNIKYSVVLHVGDELSFVSEQLPPSRVGAPDLKVSVSSRVLDVK